MKIVLRIIGYSVAIIIIVAFLRSELVSGFVKLVSAIGICYYLIALIELGIINGTYAKREAQFKKKSRV